MYRHWTCPDLYYSMNSEGFNISDTFKNNFIWVRAFKTKKKFEELKNLR